MRSNADNNPSTEKFHFNAANSFGSNTGSAQVLTNVSSNSTVLLATAQVEIRDAWGRYQKVRVLLDGGSQINVITQSCVDK